MVLVNLFGTASLLGSLFLYVREKRSILRHYSSHLSLCQDNAVKAFHSACIECHRSLNALFPSLAASLSTTHYPSIEVTKARLKELSNTKSATDNTKQEKKFLWEQLKLSSWNRVVSSLYIAACLCVIHSLQITLLKRESLLQQQRQQQQLTKENGKANEDELMFLDEEGKRQFLSFSWYVMNIGFLKIEDKIKATLLTLIETMPLKESVDANVIESILSSIADKLEQQLDLTEISFPTEDEYPLVMTQSGIQSLDPSILPFLSELQDCLKHPDLQNVIKSVLADGMIVLISQFKDKTMTMAAASAEVCKFFDKQFEPDSDLIDKMTTNGELRAFMAIILTTL